MSTKKDDSSSDEGNLGIRKRTEIAAACDRKEEEYLFPQTAGIGGRHKMNKRGEGRKRRKVPKEGSRGERTVANPLECGGMGEQRGKQGH